MRPATRRIWGHPMGPAWGGWLGVAMLGLGILPYPGAARTVAAPAASSVAGSSARAPQQAPAPHAAQLLASHAPQAPAPVQIDRVHSYFVAVTGRAGVLGFVGHQHGVLAPIWEAEIRYDPQHAEDSSVQVRVPVADLVVDTLRARRRARLGKGPGQDDVAEIHERMLGPDQLDAANHPGIEFRSESVERVDAEHLQVHGRLTLVGVTHDVTVPVHIRHLQQFTIFEGEIPVLQRDYGIEPVSVGGVIKVANRVRIRFEVWTTPPAR